MTNGLHLSQAEKQVVLAMRATRNEAEATKAKASKAKVELKEDVKKQKLMPKKEEPMIKHDQGHGGVKVINHDVEAETALIKHGQTYIDVKMHQGPEGWTVFEFGNEMHTMEDLPSLAITGKHGPLVLHEPSTAMGSNEHGTQRLKKHRQTRSCKRRMTSCNSS